MRHWNWFCYTFSFHTPYLFLPYLWGIETFENIPRYAVKVYRFYPTYEALKQLPITRSFLEKLCFYPTYEALKPWWDEWDQKEKESFYPTYEALKHPRLEKQFKGMIVFTLPMRHWNLVLVLFWKYCLMVFTLPMRHWNPSPHEIQHLLL